MKEGKIYWNDKEFLDAIRLLNDFFPESKTFINQENGANKGSVINSMKIAGMKCDYSCEEFQTPKGPDLGFSKKGGFSGINQQILSRLLSHCEFKPKGRTIAMPDTIKNWTTETVYPIICDMSALVAKLDEFDGEDKKDQFFRSQSRDKLLAFESGEIIFMDHDQRLFWAKSKNKI